MNRKKEYLFRMVFGLFLSVLGLFMSLEVTYGFGLGILVMSLGDYIIERFYEKK